MSEEPEDSPSVTTLETTDAIALWLETSKATDGSHPWNEWVAKNPKANVDFSDVDFTNIRGDIADHIDFSHFHFPNGATSFKKVKFGEGDVNFTHTHFGHGKICFSFAEFGNGNISFSGSQFGEGGVDFSNTNFGEGEVDFSEVKFGNGDVYFIQSKFCEGSIYFDYSEFGVGNIYFNFTEFGNGNVDFYKTNFCEGNTDFHGAKFGNGNVDFQFSIMNGPVIFTNNDLIGPVKMDFSSAKFDGSVIIDNTMNLNFLNKLSFQYASFEDVLALPKGQMNCIPNLLNTKLSHQVTSHDLKCKLVFEARKKNFGNIKWQKIQRMQGG